MSAPRPGRKQGGIPLFPRELLSVRRRGDRIHPQFAPVDDEHLALARELIDLFEVHVGARRKAFLEDLEQHELRMGTRFKLVRGLATLLERRSTFEVASRIDPSRVRRVAWDQAARLADGAATTPEARARVLAAAADELGLSPEEVARALVADRDEELLLVAFDAPDPEWLLHRYNVSMAQTLLFDAVRVEVEIERGFREFLGLVKLNGLMHVVERAEDGTHRVVIDGPLSLFRDTRRYGTGIAKALPGLARCGRWTLRADIQDKEADKRRVFETSEDELRIPRAVADEEDAYDSEVERRFAEDWGKLRTPWRIEREPAALQVAGGELLIPDFGFAWGDGPVTAYLEIVGFWTPGYLKRKIEKLRKLPGDTAILLAVDRELGVGEEGFADTPGEVLLYKKHVPLVPVVQWLREREAAHVDDEAARLVEALGGRVDAPVVTVAGLAQAHAVTVDAVERALPKLDVGERVRVGDALVTPDLLEEMDAALSDGMTVGEVQAVAGPRGLADTSSLLEHLGYAVAWRGLDPASAVIEKKSPG